ncbi:uncharacterized protein A4U43_C10F6890 [Asparagus officinalis]|uniref:VASt domain-containing protein n=1 Tax=Asparagus officinalis TaxID=4686 RepID=A0A5P1E1N4_ASPOF|nr:uncharacterized protein A4U43_C10F6890 [Asparagus officinalis]
MAVVLGSSPKEESESAFETSSVHSGDTSGLRDADIMTEVLMSRSEEYRLLFRLPKDEVLVQDFNCAFQENILLQGHMYLFIHHICFYSNIFGFETKKTIAFHEVTYVRKAKTAAIFPNAIEIITGDKKHFFGSFLSRDEAYRLIVDGWAQHNDDSRALLDHQESKSENNQDNDIVVVERVTGSTEFIDASSSAERTKDANASEKCKLLLNGNSESKASENFQENQENGKHANSDNPPSSEPSICEELDAPEIPENFTLVIEAKFPVTVEEFFTLFISDNASNFLENVHQRCGDKDFLSTPWRPHEKFGHARDLSFLHPVNVYIGAKFGRCQEVQKYRVFKNSHLVIETSQQVSDVPFADYFHVKRIWDVEKIAEEENSCIMRVYFNVAFSKKTMFKGKIEQSTKDELREVHAIWINNAHELLKQKNEVKQKGIADRNADMIQDQNEGAGSSSGHEGSAENLRPTVNPSVAPQTVLLGNSGSRINCPVQEYSIITSVMSIIILLTRVPEVHVINHGNQISGISGYRAENIEWMEKRVDYLKEEMFMVETQLERMRHEHAMLKSHLLSLESFKPKS